MSDIDTYIKKYSEIPECCKLCKRLNIDDIGCKDPMASCGIDLRFPVLKGSCNAQIAGGGEDALYNGAGVE